MYRKIVIGIIAIIIFIGVFYFINYSQTINITDSKMIAKAIVNRHSDKYSNGDLINIAEEQHNKNQYFVLFQYGDEPYSLAIFEEVPFGNKKRYKYIGGSSQSSEYGSFKFSQPVEESHEVLTVVYGDKDSINADYFTLSFQNGTTIKQDVNNKNFIYIYRFYSLSSDNGHLRFYDKSGKEI